jgi:hypothetical protein
MRLQTAARLGAQCQKGLKRLSEMVQEMSPNTAGLVGVGRVCDQKLPLGLSRDSCCITGMHRLLGMCRPAL